jgi:hypothetical protein
MPIGIYIRTKLARRNMRLSHLNVPLSKEHRRAIGLGQTGLHHSKKWCKNISLGNKGLPHNVSIEGRIRMGSSHRNESLFAKHKRGRAISLANMGRIVSKATKKKISITETGKILSKSTIQKILKSNGRRPNQKEKYLNSILQKNFPNEWKYVGQGDFVLGGKNPDFVNVNGKKLLIELFGGLGWWHSEKDVQPRINHFKQFGFDTLIIWEGELKNKVEVINRITNFIGD